MTIVSNRQEWMSVLAKSETRDLERCWRAYSRPPDYAFLRRPEIGLVMVRGRMGGTGGQFNLGELTLTRCSVKTETDSVGHGYVLGRRPRHAELAAVFDALFQMPGQDDQLLEQFLKSLQERLLQKKDQVRQEAGAGKVEFFTLVRGEDP